MKETPETAAPCTSALDALMRHPKTVVNELDSGREDDTAWYVVVPHKYAMMMANERDEARIERDDALLTLGNLQDFIRELYGLDRKPDTLEEVKRILEYHSGDGIHTCHANCQKPACRLRRELADARVVCDTLREALRKAVLWAGCLAARVPDRSGINWTYLEEARAVLAVNPFPLDTAPPVP